MRALLLGAVAAGVFLTPLARSSADEPKAIIDKAAKAHGGAEKLAKITGIRLKTKGRVEVAGGIDFIGESTVQVPDKLKEISTLTVNGMQIKVTVVYDGKEAWSNDPVQGTKKLEGAALDSLKDGIEAGNLARLAFVGGKEYELGPLGEIDVNGRKAVGVKVSRKNGKDVNLYFDKETGLLTKFEHRTKDAMSGKEVNEERFILEYQEVDGLKTAKKMLIKRDGEKYIEAETTEVAYLDKIDASEFEKP
jgi:hypothetical protein